MNNVYTLDFETTPFRKKAKKNYELRERFVNLVKLDTLERFHFNFEKNEHDKFKEFFENLCKKKKKIVIYAHNLKFDYAFLTRYLPNQYNRKVINRGSSIIAIELYVLSTRKYKGKLKEYKRVILSIRDSFALFPGSLETIGNDLGFPKLKQDYNAEITIEYIEYCYIDCEIIIKALIFLRDLVIEMFDIELKLNRLPYTLPSLAKKIEHKLIERQYGKSLIKRIYDVSIDLENYVRPYYCGGRVEVYNFNRCSNGSYNDFNSHYANPMFNESFPIPPYRRYKCNDNDKCFMDFTKNKNIFACLCEVNENSHIPLVPYKTDKGKLLFANGVKTFFLFRKEIEYLIKNKQSVKIIELFLCSEYLPIFKKYIGKFYEFKKNSIGFKRFIAKRLLVSLYGKFAEKREKTHLTEIRDIENVIGKDIENVQIICSDDFNNESEYIEREINTELKFLKREQIISETLKVNVIFSMMITAHCRLILTEALVEQYSKYKDDLYLCDSDSFVSQNPANYGIELGQLKQEFIFNDFQALGCKEYVYELIPKAEFHFSGIPFIHIKNVIYKMKGFPKNLNFKTINAFLDKYLKKKKFNRMVGYLEHYVREFDLRTMIYQEKIKHSFYDKRWINDDYTTKPYHLDDSFQNLVENNKEKIKKLLDKKS